MRPKGSGPLEGAEDLALEVMMSRAQPSPVSAFQAYREMLFHGPVYQRVKAIEALDEGAIVARVAPSPAGAFGAGQRWVVDPGLMDAVALEVMMSRAQPSPVSAFQAYREMLF
ncbi:MAG: polyketide synthase dehydratase domain-containing protein, partial [Bacteroidota bacterium]